MKVSMRRTALDYLKHHAKENVGQEIYGWLFGVEQIIEKEFHLFILGSYSAHKYKVQTLVNTEPDTNELASIADYLPIGISNLGQYHSHPKNVFHSDTDDATLLDMAKVYKNVISVVTNGDVTKIYAVKGDKVVELEYNILEFDALHFDFIHIETPLKLDRGENSNKLASEVENKVASQLENLIIHKLINKQIKLQKIDLGKKKINMKFKIPILDQNRTLKIKSNNNELDMDVKKYVLNVHYESIVKFEKKNISPDILDYHGLPINVMIKSFCRSTAKDRSILLQSFGLKKEADMWRKIAD